MVVCAELQPQWNFRGSIVCKLGGGWGQLAHQKLRSGRKGWNEKIQTQTDYGQQILFR